VPFLLGGRRGLEHVCSLPVVVSLLRATWKRLLLIEIIAAVAYLVVALSRLVDSLWIPLVVNGLCEIAVAAWATAAALMILHSVRQGEAGPGVLASFRLAGRYPLRLLRLWGWWVLLWLPGVAGVLLMLYSGWRVLDWADHPVTQLLIFYVTFILLLLPMAIMIEGRGLVRAVRLAHASWPVAGLLLGWLAFTYLLGLIYDPLPLVVSVAIEVVVSVAGAVALYVIYLLAAGSAERGPGVAASDEVALGG
jgi:hypothetical protein